jgi:hypothetical protein
MVSIVSVDSEPNKANRVLQKKNFIFQRAFSNYELQPIFFSYEKNNAAFKDTLVNAAALLLFVTRTEMPTINLI